MLERILKMTPRRLERAFRQIPKHLANLSEAECRSIFRRLALSTFSLTGGALTFLLMTGLPERLKIGSFLLGAATTFAMSFALASFLLRRKQTLARAPGWRLGQIARLIFGRKIYSQIIEPQLSDHLIEYSDALAEGQTKTAKWICVRCWIVLALSMIAQCGVSLTRLCVALWKATAR
jgi:hypothetical protein